MSIQHSTDSLIRYLIESVTDAKALKVSLTLLSIIENENPIPVEENEILNNEMLNKGLLLNKHSIRTGLNTAVQDQAILKLYKSDDETKTSFYIANIEHWIQSAKSSGYLLQNIVNNNHPNKPEKSQHINEPINIYRLYETHIGTITPSISEELKEAEALYDPAWITEAFNIAVTSEKNNWRYISTILTRWNLEGKKDGKFRRHTQAPDNNKYINEYRRLRTRDS